MMARWRVWLLKRFFQWALNGQCSASSYRWELHLEQSACLKIERDWSAWQKGAGDLSKIDKRPVLDGLKYGSVTLFHISRPHQSPSNWLIAMAALRELISQWNCTFHRMAAATRGFVYS